MDTMIARVRDVHASQDWSTLEDLSSWVVREALSISSRFPRQPFMNGNARSTSMNASANCRLWMSKLTRSTMFTAVLRGKTRDAALLIMAHTDTVFPADTDLSVTRGAGKISRVRASAITVSAWRRCWDWPNPYLNQRGSPPVTSGWLPIAAKRVWATCAGPRQPSPSCNPVSTQ